MNNKAILFFAILFFAVYITSNTEQTKATHPKNPPVHAASKVEPVTNNELDKICAIAIAADFGKKIEDIQIAKPYSDSSNTVRVGYVRKSDNTKWNFECKFSLDKKIVAWRGLKGTTTDYIGRWRDGMDDKWGDSRITYSVHDKSIGINVSRQNADGVYDAGEQYYISR